MIEIIFASSKFKIVSKLIQVRFLRFLYCKITLLEKAIEAEDVIAQLSFNEHSSYWLELFNI